MDAILENTSNQNWYYESLNDAAYQLKNNNTFFRLYKHITLQVNQNSSRIIFLTATISDTQNFINNLDEKQLPISYNNKNLKGLLFSDLFSNRKGFYNDTFNNKNRQKYINNYQKYINHCLLSSDLRFRLYLY